MRHGKTGKKKKTERRPAPGPRLVAGGKSLVSSDIPLGALLEVAEVVVRGGPGRVEVALHVHALVRVAAEKVALGLRRG